MTRKRGTRPLCSLQRESCKTFLDGGQVWVQDAGYLSVAFDLRGFYLPSITSSLRKVLDYFSMAYRLLSELYRCGQIWDDCGNWYTLRSFMLIQNRILHSIGQLNVGSYTGVYAIPFVVHTSLYLVFLLQLVVSLVPTSALAIDS